MAGHCTKRETPSLADDEKSAVVTDEESPPPPKKEKVEAPLSPKVIILVRHGDYNTWTNIEEQGLTKCRQIQAATAGKALLGMAGRPVIKELVSSTMVRAVQTANIIKERFPAIPLRMDPELEEGNPDMPYHKLRFDRVYNAYFVPSQESTMEAQVLICHANIIRYIVCRAIGMNIQNWKQLWIPNCSLTAITIHPTRKPILNFMGSCSHVHDPDLRFR